MEAEIKKMLSSEEVPENIQRLLKFLKDNLKRSREAMGKYYDRWDKNIDIYRGNRTRDEDDQEAAEFNEPEKMIVPLSFAQTQTFVAFGFLLLLQNKKFYELEPTGREDYLVREPGELFLQRDLNHNRWPNKLYQFLLDLARCTIGVTKECWKVSTTHILVPQQQDEFSLGSLTFTGSQSEAYEEVLVYEGNEIFNIRPQAFLPDARLPLTRWMDGQFCADEEEFHIQTLKQLERQGKMAGTKHLEKMTDTQFSERGPSKLSKLAKEVAAGNSKKGVDENDFMVVITEVQIKLIPADYGLGPEEFPLMHLVHIANDRRIVNIERSGYVHGGFTYNVAQFSPDNQSLLNESLCDVTSALQDVITWLINARILSVRRSLDDRIVVDPSVINMASIEAGSPVITLKSGAPRTGIDRFIQQLKVTDTTASHMQDAETLSKLMYSITGVNENAMGQFSPGRRSATENRAANSGAASRMKVIVTNAFHEALNPMGRKMLINSRFGTSFETFRKVLGEREDLEQLFEAYVPSDPRLLVGSEDFFLFDSTLSSEKGYLAQSLQELFGVIMSNPETMAALPIDPAAMLEEIYTLRGVTNTKRFFRPAQATLPAGGSVPGGAPPEINPAAGGVGPIP